MENNLPAIPPKRYFTIGEVSELCGVKPHVLRYWEQEFAQLRPVKRRGNRRYYQRHEVLLVRRIRDLLYEQGFTISGARNRLAELGPGAIRALEDEQDLDEALAEAAAPPAPAMREVRPLAEEAAAEPVFSAPTFAAPAAPDPALLPAPPPPPPAPNPPAAPGAPVPLEFPVPPPPPPPGAIASAPTLDASPVAPAA